MRITKKDGMNSIVSWIFTIGALGVVNYLSVPWLITIFEALTWMTQIIIMLVLFGSVILIFQSEDFIDTLFDKMIEDPDKYKFGSKNVILLILFGIPSILILSYYGYTALLVAYLINILVAISLSLLFHIISEPIREQERDKEILMKSLFEED